MVFKCGEGEEANEGSKFHSGGKMFPEDCCNLHRYVVISNNHFVITITKII